MNMYKKLFVPNIQKIDEVQLSMPWTIWEEDEPILVARFWWVAYIGRIFCRDADWYGCRIFHLLCIRPLFLRMHSKYRNILTFPRIGSKYQDILNPVSIRPFLESDRNLANHISSSNPLRLTPQHLTKCKITEWLQFVKGQTIHLKCRQPCFNHQDFYQIIKFQHNLLAANIGPRSGGGTGKKPGYGTGKQTLRLKSNGTGQVEEVESFFLTKEKVLSVVKT